MFKLFKISITLHYFIILKKYIYCFNIKILKQFLYVLFKEHLPSSGAISSLSDCISFIGFKDSYNFSSSPSANVRTRCSGGQECLRLKIIRKKEISKICVSCAPNVFVKQQNQKIIPNYCHEFKVQPTHSALKSKKS